MHRFHHFLFEKNHLSPTFKKILEHEMIDTRSTINDIVNRTQKKWLRPADSERWHLSETKNTTQRQQLLHWFGDIGMINPVLPRKKQYDYILFMGGDLHGMQERLDFLCNLCKDVSATQLIFLTAERSLDPEHESAEKINLAQSHTLKTEYDLLQALYKETDLPQSLKTLKPIYINTPNHIRNGKECRATTPDTIIEWLKQEPRPGSCLIISSQPLIGYQNAVAHTLLPTFSIDSVGPASSTPVTIPEYLDTLTRWLYQEMLNFGP